MMFRGPKDTQEYVDSLFHLAMRYMHEGTPCGLISAYKILITLHEQHPDKAITGAVGRVKVRLEKMGLLDEVLKEEATKTSDAGTLRARL